MQMKTLEYKEFRISMTKTGYGEGEFGKMMEK